MLQKLNERIQGVIAWVVIGLVAFTFTLFGVDSYIQAHHASAVEAEVDGQSISKHAFELQYRRMRQAQEASGMTDGAEKELKRQILDDMIATQVNTRAARHYGFGLDAAQANAAIFQIPQFQQDGHFSPDRYQQTLSNALFTAQSFQEEVRQGMLLNQQRFAFMGTAFALPEEIEKFVKLYGQSRDYRYVRIPSTAFFDAAQVSEDEVKTYYEQHPDEFLSPEAVQLDVVKLSMSVIREGFKPTDIALKTYYENNQNNYMAPAKWSVRHVLFNTAEDASKAELEAVSARAEAFYNKVQASPAEFEARGKEAVSLEKPGTTVAGVLPWIVAGESELDSELIHLTHKGELLGPIKTDSGYELFQLIAYEPAKVRPFAEVKTEVQEHWLALHAQTEYSRLLEELTDQSYQTPDSLTLVSETLSLPLEQTERFSRDGGHDALTQSPEVIKAAFSHDVLELGNNSAPIQFDEDTVVVIRVREHLKAKQKPLSQVASAIKNHLRHKKAQVKAAHMGETLLHTKGSAQDNAPFLMRHLAWQTVTQATRESSLAPTEVNHLAFTLSDAKKRAGLSLEGDSGYVVVELTKVVDGKMSSLDPEQIASISQQIGSNYGAIDYDLYVNQLLDKAKIVKH
ncbi:MAG: SurA N-terminal domain-containing protein [Legionellaceae bacterium]|nr:SurA N-terminal domain-containing protein [Legionellaceae bacterium]